MVRMACNDRDMSRELLKAAIVETAVTHQLVTPYTSRVAVEERIERRPDGTLRTVRVPTPLPRGWRPGGFYATATDDPARLIAGSVAIAAALVLLLVRRGLLRERATDNS